MPKKTEIYTVHDRISDTYHNYRHLTGVALHEQIPYDTLVNKFTRDKLKRHVTPDAKVIVKADLT
jgi:hypothetical protein